MYRDAFRSAITGEDVMKETGEGDGNISPVVSRTSGPIELALAMLFDEGKISVGEEWWVGNIAEERSSIMTSVVIRGFGASELVVPLLTVLERGKVSVSGVSSSCTKKDVVRNNGRVGDGNISSAVISLSECGVVVTTVGRTKPSEGKSLSVESSGRREAESIDIMLDGTNGMSLAIVLESGLDTLRDIGGSDSRTEDKGVGNVDGERFKNVSSVVTWGFGATELVVPLLTVLERGKVSVSGVISSCEVGKSGRVEDGNISSAVISIPEYSGIVTTVEIAKTSEGKNISVEKSEKTESESTEIMLDVTNDVSLVLSI